MTMRTLALVALLTVPWSVGCRKTDVAALEQRCGQDDKKACDDMRKHFQAGCDKADMKSCNELAAMHFRFPPPPDEKQAIELFDRSCRGGYGNACKNLVLLADIWAKGEGIPKDTAKAAALYRMACDGGMTESCEKAKQVAP